MSFHITLGEQLSGPISELGINQRAVSNILSTLQVGICLWRAF